MQQRPTGFSRAPDDHCVVNIPLKYSPRWNINDADDGDLSIYDPRSEIEWKEMLKSRLREKWIHIIPAIIVLCFFILWWFSYPVTLDMKDGKIIGIHQVYMQLPMNNNTEVDLAILASITSPPLSPIVRNFTRYNETQ